VVLDTCVTRDFGGVNYKIEPRGCMWADSSVVEHLTADQEVTGSNPVRPSLLLFY
jgi:hypothetical protein